MIGHFNRRVYVTRNPVAVPVREATAVGTTRYRPDVVAEVNSTAWKYKGALKSIAFIRKAATKLENIMLARGLLCKRSNGMTGSLALLSTQRQTGKHMPKMTSDETVRGCDPVIVSI
jgi:hypothetical protein